LQVKSGDVTLHSAFKPAALMIGKMVYNVMH
jgi:hypothetical protein